MTPETFRLLVVVNSGTPSSATAKIASTTLGCMSKRATTMEAQLQEPMRYGK